MEKPFNLIDRPVLSRSEVYNYLSERIGMRFDIDRCNRDTAYANEILQAALSDKSVWKEKQEPSPIFYCITFTTRVVDGVPCRNYVEFMETFRRIAAMSVVVSVSGNFELTQQNALHAHVIVKTDGRYLDLTKVRRFNKNEFIKADKIKSDKHMKACEMYIYKAVDDPQTLKFLERNGVSTTRISVSKTPTEPLALIQ